jgi:hypothetical protein
VPGQAVALRWVRVPHLFFNDRYNIEEAVMADKNLDVSLATINVGLSPRAFQHLLELLDYDAGSGDEATDADLSRKIRDEMRVARSYAEPDRKPAIKVHEVTDEELAEVSPTYAEHIADKMAKAARAAVDDDPRGAADR